MTKKLTKIRESGKSLYTKTQHFLKKYEKILMPVFLLLGFFIDTLTLNRVDQIFDNLILIFYIILASLTIYIYHHGNSHSKLKVFAPFIMQYAFGGLFSGLVIFYFKSSNFWTSLPFLSILLFLFIGNDFIHRKYQKLLFQISILYIGIFSYSILIVPIILERTSNLTYIIGATLSLTTIFTLVFLLKKKLNINKGDLINIKISIWVIFFIFNFLYLTNIIPPIPLSMKEGFPAYNIKKSKDDYVVLYDKNPWYIFWNKYNNKIYLDNNEPAFVFTSVFAPSNFESTIFHEWSFFNNEKNRWIVTDNIPIQIYGGLDRGYRGYSTKNNLPPGDWKVNIKNNTGQTIGRVMFKIIPSKVEPALTEITI